MNHATVQYLAKKFFPWMLESLAVACVLELLKLHGIEVKR